MNLNPSQFYQHSLKVILDNQQPGGAYLACPIMPDYQFSWFRDGAYIAYALTLDGQAASFQHGGSLAAQWESAQRFHDWCSRMVNQRAERLERSIARARADEPPDMHDILNARYCADGSAGPDSWPEFQLDGPGTWLWSLSEFVRITRLTPLPEDWQSAVTLTASYLAALWQTPCYDCWEERGDDIHISTLGAIFAGLKAAQTLVPGSEFEPVLHDIRRFILTYGLTPGGELAKSVGLDMVDANLVSVALPHGVFELNDPVIQKTVARIERDLHAPNSGLHRHRADTYYGGGVWVLLALCLAWYYLETGETDRAQQLYVWSLQQADAGGNLPEQVNEVMLSADFYNSWVKQRGPIACPLLWTHAMYLIVRSKLRPR